MGATTSGGRETAGCAVCKSTLRLRGLVALLSQEIFGVAMALPEFPTMKGIRGLGMSDSPELAERLAEKFDYTGGNRGSATSASAGGPPSVCPGLIGKPVERRSLLRASQHGCLRAFAGMTPVAMATATACVKFMQLNLWRAVSR